jgi:hypothetical protein
MPNHQRGCFFAAKAAPTKANILLGLFLVVLCGEWLFLTPLLLALAFNYLLLLAFTASQENAYSARYRLKSRRANQRAGDNYDH